VHCRSDLSNSRPRSQIGQLLTAFITLSIFIGLACPAQADSDSKDIQQSWWLKFQNRETSKPSPGGSDSKSLRASDASAPDSGSEPTQQSYFTIPGYFASQPKPFERPTEFFRSPTLFGSPSQALWGGAWGGGSSWSPWTCGGYWNSVGLGAFNGWSGAGAVPGFGLGGWGSPLGFRGWGSPWAWGGPFGYGGGISPLGRVGLGWWGGLGGWGSFGAPYAGPFGRAGFGSRVGMVTPTRVFQTAPSKASGNYYAPSTVDTTASGSYYASGAPAVIPIIQPKKQITNFWGPAGNPFPTDLNSSPWNQSK